MLTDTEIDSMRATVESALTDECSITRRTAGVLDPDTGAYTVTTPVPLWSGPCRVRSRVAAARDVQVGDAHTTVGQYYVTLPVDAEGFDIDDYLVVTRSATSVELIGVPMQILDVQLGTWDLGRRLVAQTARP